MAGARSSVISILSLWLQPHEARAAWEMIEEHFALNPDLKDVPGAWAIEKMGLLTIIERQSARLAELTSQGEDQ